MSEDELRAYIESMDVSDLDLEAIIQQSIDEAVVENSDTDSNRSNWTDGPRITVQNAPLELQYEASKQEFLYRFPNGTEISMNVPIGAYTKETVFLSFPKSVFVSEAYRDGVLINAASGTELSYRDSGEYVFFLGENIDGRNGREYYESTISFVIGEAGAKNTSLISAPMGLHIEDTFLDGKPLEAGGSEYLYLTRDGNYEIRFADAEGNACWEMVLRRDTTAPSLRFEPEFRRSYTEAVRITSSEKDVDVLLTRDGVEVTDWQSALDITGDYAVTVSDPAGNSRFYQFHIDIPVHVLDYQLYIILLLFLFFAIGAFLYWKKNVRVI